MADYIVSCDDEFYKAVDLSIRCDGAITVTQKPQLVDDLTQEQIGEISTAVLFLFAVAFVFRLLRRFVEVNSPGRN